MFAARSQPTPRATRVLTDVAQVIEPALHKTITQLPADIRHIVSYHRGWCDAAGHPRHKPAAKALRPALVLTCARAAGNYHTADAIPAAVAVELVHDFSLLHDDIMDNDRTRRHQAAAWTVFGVGRTILAGDTLLALAVETMLKSGSNGAAAAFSTALLELCAGQSMDLQHEASENVTLEDCVTAAKKKTGALFGLACQLGALTGTTTDTVAATYRDIGRHLGVAFQLVDDVLAIWGDPTQTGKPSGSDVTSHKKSLPVAAALTAATPSACELAALYRFDRPFTRAEITRAAELIDAAGGRSWACNEADSQRAQALSLLQTVDPIPAASDDLRSLAHLMTSRNH